MLTRAAALGALLAVVAMAGLHWPFHNEALNGLALFLAFTGCVYPGALLAQRSKQWVATSELGVGIAILASAWMGVAIHPLWLAAGYFGHGVWDWFHHAGGIPTKVAGWFPPACAAFDFLIALYAAWLVI